MYNQCCRASEPADMYQQPIIIDLCCRTDDLQRPLSIYGNSVDEPMNRCINSLKKEQLDLTSYSKAGNISNISGSNFLLEIGDQNFVNSVEDNNCETDQLMDSLAENNLVNLPVEEQLIQNMYTELDQLSKLQHDGISLESGPIDLTQNCSIPNDLITMKASGHFEDCKGVDMQSGLIGKTPGEQLVSFPPEARSSKGYAVNRDSQRESSTVSSVADVDHCDSVGDFCCDKGQPVTIKDGGTNVQNVDVKSGGREQCELSQLLNPENSEGYNYACLLDSVETNIQEVEKQCLSEPVFHVEDVCEQILASSTVEIVDFNMMCMNERDPIISLMTQDPTWHNIINPAKIGNMSCLFLEGDFLQKPLQTVTPKLPPSKQALFNPDHNNIPHTILSSLTEHQAEPQLMANENRYDAINVAVRQNKIDDHDIEMTYLYSEKCANLKDGIGAWGIDSYRCEFTGDLVDGTKMRCLVDTGATRNILHINSLKDHPLLREYPITKIQPAPLYMADNHKVLIKELITFVIFIDGHFFELTAQVMNTVDRFDLIIGTKSMFELEGNINYPTMQVTFRARSLPIVPKKTQNVLPNKTELFSCVVPGLPIECNHLNTEVVAKLLSGLPERTVQTVKLQLYHGELQVKCTNATPNKKLVFKAGEVIGYLDLRSLGYFQLPRISLQRNIQQYFRILDEDQTIDCFNFIQDKVIDVPLKQRLPAKMDTDTNQRTKNDPWPWLDDDDPRRKMTDKEIIHKYVDLSESDLDDQQKALVYKTIMKFKEAFSLRDEIGTCPFMEVHLDIRDKSPFFLRPFPCSEEEKEVVNKQMRKGCLLGIMKEGMSSYSSPIMLIPRKLGGIPRIVTDFRLLNTRLIRLNPSIPLVRDAMQLLGASEVEVISVIDLRDAYHTLRLDKESQKFCGITPFYGSPTYIYLRLAMGLSVSPAIWQSFITSVLRNIAARKHFLAIMDDLLIHSTKAAHLGHLINLFRALINNGLKISPKKCQLYRKKLVYMGHTILVEPHGACITPLQNNVDPVLKLEPPTTPKDCKSLCGMVNFLSMYLPKLQELLRPIYQLTRKGVKFEWSEECQENLDTIKKLLTEPPVLSMPKPKGRYLLVSDTSKFACGGTLYQVQDGKYRLVGYLSKSLPEPAQRYSISELELLGLAVNMMCAKHLLGKRDFDCVVDHSALVHIMTGTKEPPTLRIKKLMEILKGFNYTLYYKKGKDMYVTDFLSRHPVDQGKNTDEIIPIAFQLSDQDPTKHGKLYDELVEQENTPNHIKDIFGNVHTCHICQEESNWNMVYMALTRSQAKSQGISLPSVAPFSEDKHTNSSIPAPTLDNSNLTPPTVVPVVEDPPSNVPTTFPLPNIPNMNVPVLNMPLPKSLPNLPCMRPVQQLPPNIPPPLLDPVRPGLIDENIPELTFEDLLNQNLKPGMEESDDFNPNEDYLRPPDNPMYKKLYPLIDSIRDDRIYRKHIPKQVELNKYLELLKSKIIHDYQLPLTIQEMKAEYGRSPYFKHIYKYIKHGLTNLEGTAAHIFKLMCQDFIIVEEMLFKLIPHHDKNIGYKCALCIPEKYIPSILHVYHDLYLAGHQGINKMHDTLRQLYYFPNMYDCIRKYLISCHNCQSRRPRSEELEVAYARIPLDFKPMKRMSIDVKHMPPGKYGMNYILICTCEFTGYTEATALQSITSQNVAGALDNLIFSRYGRITTIIHDQASYLTSELMRTVFKILNVKPAIVSPENHGSLKVERYIQSINKIISKYLTGSGDMWPMFIKSACFAMNTFVNPITGFSPHQMIYLEDPPNPLNYEFNFETKGLMVDTKNYINIMKYRKNLMDGIIRERTTFDKTSQLVQSIRKHPNYQKFCLGDLVFLHAPTASSLQAPSRKMRQEWIGPLKISEIKDDTHYKVSDLDGRELPMSIHIKRLKMYHINMGTIDDKTLQTFSNIGDLLDYVQRLKKEKGEEIPIKDTHYLIVYD